MELEDCETSLVETTIIKPAETDAVRPVTIYQALRSGRLHGDTEFTLDGAKFSKVLLVTHVISSSDTSDVRGVYDLEDGTGSIRGSWINKAGLDPIRFSEYHGSLAVIIGRLVQFGQKKSVEIGSMRKAGYHQVMFHTLECMKLSLPTESLTGPPAPHTSGCETVVTGGAIPCSNDSTRIDYEPSSDSYYSFCFPDSDQGGNDVGPLQPDAPFPLVHSDVNHGEGSSSELIAQAAPQHPTLPHIPQVEPEVTGSGFVIDQVVVNPRTVARTPSPLSSFSSSLHITTSRYFVRQYGQAAQLGNTQLVIVSSLCQLQGDAPYGVWMDDVFQNVTKVIEITWEEFIRNIDWLLDEVYIVRPLDDNRIAVTPRASV